MSLKDRLQHGWNAFMGRDPTVRTSPTIYASSPAQYVALQRGGDRFVVMSDLNRIAVDVASITIEHVRLDENGRYKEPMKSSFNNCLTLAANSDQTGRAFIQDAALSLLTEGVIGILPTEATEDPRFTGSYDIGKLRVCKVIEWYPQHVKLEVYNEITGNKEERIYPKSMVALPENPFYAVMNAPNSTYQRLLSKLRQLDMIDTQSSSGKLDIILQVPYSTKSPTRKNLADQRRAEVERQLAGSKYGVAYIDTSEKVIQLNRAVENNLFSQVEYYTNMLHSQLGLPPSVFDGTATQEVLLNYQTRTIEPIVSSLVDAMKWKFLTPTARTKGQSVVFLTNPFKLAPVNDIANNADKFIRNEILTKNEFRQIIGFKPSDDPSADQLNNPNMPMQDDAAVSEEKKDEENQNE